MKRAECEFSDGMNDALVAETFCECIELFFMALFRSTRYRMGRANGKFCVWSKRE